MSSVNSMKAVVMSGYGTADVFSIQEVPKPEPQEGQIRIRIRVSGFNPVDWKIRNNWYGGPAPRILGMDCSGIVDAVGPSTSLFSIGDEVYAMTFFRSSGGSYAEYVCVPVELVAKKPKNISFEEAAAIPLAAMTAYRAIVAPSAFKEGDVVFAAGLGGGVGVFAVQFFRLLDIREIFTTAKDEASAQFLYEKLGIPRDHVLIYDGLSTEQLREQMIAMNHGRLFDATLDLVGGETKKLCLELTGCSGHFSTILPEQHFEFPFWGENDIPRARNLSVHQVAIGSEIETIDRKCWQIYTRHLGHITKMLERGELRPPFVKTVGSLCARTVQQAHALLERGHVKGKLVMVVE